MKLALRALAFFCFWWLRVGWCFTGIRFGWRISILDFIYGDRG